MQDQDSDFARQDSRADQRPISDGADTGVRSLVRTTAVEPPGEPEASPEIRRLPPVLENIDSPATIASHSSVPGRFYPDPEAKLLKPTWPQGVESLVSNQETTPNENAVYQRTPDRASQHLANPITSRWSAERDFANIQRVSTARQRLRQIGLSAESDSLAELLERQSKPPAIPMDKTERIRARLHELFSAKTMFEDDRKTSSEASQSSIR